jgi:predicted DCC family thiol-disulfide oxidoreductase YuxK
MTGLTVLYDATCPVCRRARRFVERQPTYVPVSFLAAGGFAARRRFPTLDPASTRRTITVVADDGAVYRGDAAWIAVLWAVASTRKLANDVAVGRRRFLFGSVKGAAEWVRRLTTREIDPGGPLPPPSPMERVG